MSIHNLLVLPDLPTRQIRRKEPLVDYIMSHVVTSEEHLNIMQSKAMAKVVTYEIRECKWKKRKKNGPKKPTETFTVF